MSCLGLILAAFFAWVLQAALYQRIWNKGLTASVSFCQDHAVEGDCAALVETVANAKYLPLAALHVKFQMGRELVFLKQENSNITDQNYRSDIFSCMPWQEIRRRLEFCCRKRGYYTIRQIDLTSHDLLWSSHFFMSVPADTAMYVYPAFVDPVRLSLPLRQLAGLISAKNALQRDPFELQSIRDYTSRDPYRDINWKATARTGTLKVNVHIPACSWQVMLLLDGSSDRAWEDSGLREESVRLCATLAKELLARQIPVSVRSNGIDCLTHEESCLPSGAGSHHLRTILETLARMDFSSAGRRPMETVIRELPESSSAPAGLSRRDTILYVLISSCQRPALADAYSALCRHASGSQWILPLRPDDSVRINTPDKKPLPYLYPWEVPYASEERFRSETSQQIMATPS